MTIIEGENDLTHLWSIILELSEQLNQNRSLSVSLYTQAGNVKSQATHSQTGFVLRRFNLDKTKEEYEAELERMNNAMAAENQGLQHDNKQLNSLIKEYEQTLDTLMKSFRNRAKDVQERELSLVREYETKLLEMEEENATRDLAASTAISESLSKMSHLLRQCLRAQGGEEPKDFDARRKKSKFVHEREPWTTSDATQAEWALEREIELARLEKENEELRRMLGLLPATQVRREDDS
ncbi:hypothetical protein K435DRAFT_713147 [Dendrothele bispora CBS 962.96]|uniref:Uncharacterized protein n=1 Tax=Dendrothele bispora (strain CBS 962.96) TaxID=1314807 RepID=A0A4S8MQ99_DENBC|nr:hypothetical protein K435DRAFT_713147 [Dendrothele bispora CBS 962.96]